MTTIAITRPVPRSIARCELTHIARQPIDFDLATSQHEEYEKALERAGCVLVRLPAEDELPDSVFVEDTVLALDEIAIVLRPGAPSRRPETDSMKRAISKYRRIHSIVEPATIDGGDVLVDGKTIFIGMSTRSTHEAAQQLRAISAPHGYEVKDVAIRGCLHLKSAATAAAPGVILLNREFVDRSNFENRESIDVDSSEPDAANVLRAGSTLFCGAAFPRTREILARRGFAPTALDLSELAKAEGALTCCSVILSA